MSAPDDEHCRQCGMPPDPGCSFEDPRGVGPPIPLCRGCKDWAEGLVVRLGQDPILAEAFEVALRKAESGGLQ